MLTNSQKFRDVIFLTYRTFNAKETHLKNKVLDFLFFLNQIRYKNDDDLSCKMSS